jgi:hypothetical protein
MATIAPSEFKEVIMTVQGGGDMTRKRRGRKSRRQQEEGEQVGGEWAASVEKVGAAAPTPAPVTAPVPAPVQAPAQVPAPAPKQTGGQPVIVLAPAKKKPAKVMLVPKGKHPHRMLKRTFKARRVHMTVDHTAKTQKRRRQLVQRIETMTDDQLREATVAARLTRRESVANTPASLLRNMLRDYQTMKGMLL